MQDVLLQAITIILIGLVAFGLLQLLYLFWLRGPGGRAGRRALREPIMPTAVVPGGPTTAAPSYNGNEIKIEGQIVVLGGLANPSTQVLPGNEFGIGRFRNEPEQILVALDERSISRRHAVFHADGIGLYYLTDTHSTYGTFIRKGATFERLQPGQRERIYNRDELRIGQHVAIRFDLPGDTRTASTQM